MLNGLLGASWEDPRTMAALQMAQGLMNSPKLMQGAAQGAQGYGQIMAQARQQQQAEELKKLQLQQLQMQMAQQQREAQRQEKLQALAGQFQRSPQQMAMGAEGKGPTQSALAASQGMPGGFDFAGYSQALAGIDPMAGLQLQGMLRKESPAPVKVGAGEVLFDPSSGKQLFANPKAADLPSAVREYQFAQEQGYRGTFQQFQLEKARASASSTSVSYGTPVAAVDAQGNPVFIQPSKNGGAPAIIPGMRPPKSAAEERLEQERATRDRTGKQMLSVLSDAENILTGGRATASGIGNLADAGARMVGVTTHGAQDAARLDSLSGWLVANVPRMEGPQSNFDVQNYMTMAGKVGDRTTPIPERLAALREVKQLQEKYAGLNGTPVPAARPAQAKGVARTGMHNGRKVVQYSDGTVEYAD